MSYRVVDPDSIPAGGGPHPAGSPYDRRIGTALGVSAFEIYQVDLPPEAETVRHHHADDRFEDVYVILSGHGWLLVDDDATPVAPGQFLSVSLDAERQMRAGHEGLTFVAVCAASRR